MSKEAYHEYFQGYMEVMEEDKKGTERIKRVYVADFYQAELSDREWRCSKVICLICWLAVLPLFVVSARQNLPCNTTLYAGVTQSFTVLPLLLWSFTVGEYLLSKRNLTIGKFPAVHDAMIKRSIACAVFIGLCTAAVVYGMIAGGDTEIGKGVWVIVSYLICIVLCLFTGILENRRVYVRVENQTEVPEDSVMIR